MPDVVHRENDSHAKPRATKAGSLNGRLVHACMGGRSEDGKPSHSMNMNEARIVYCFRPDVAEYIRACECLLTKSCEVSLSPHEREVILLYTRKLIEAFL